jgi:hypothetical protein
VDFSCHCKYHSSCVVMNDPIALRYGTEATEVLRSSQGGIYPTWSLMLAHIFDRKGVFPLGNNPLVKKCRKGS